MPLTTAPRIVSTHVRLFRDGLAYTVPSPGTASRTSKPGAADPLWINPGVVSDFTVNKSVDEKELWAPVPGHKVLYDVLHTKAKLEVKFSTEELAPIAIELGYGTLALDGSSAQYNPLESIELRVWLKAQQYDSKDVLVNVVDMFGILKLDELAATEDPTKPAYMFKMLYSTLNTGTL